jgi:hypothetical protein
MSKRRGGEVRKELEREGWRFTQTNHGHLRGTHPGAAAPLFLSSTPSDHRSQANAVAMAKRLLRKEAK